MKRGRPPVLAVRLALAGLAGLAGCRPSRRYEIPEQFLRVHDGARFTSAVLVEPDLVLFAFSEGSYRDVDADPIQARGRREYVGGRKLLGLYELPTGEARIVRVEQRYGTGDGNGDDEVIAARGQAALLLRNRRTNEGVLIDPGGFLLLDLATGTLEPFDPAEELARLGLVRREPPRLVDGHGTLLYEARPKDAQDPPRSRLLLRRRGGAIDDLGTGTFRGELAGRIYLERPGQDGAEAIDLATGAREPLPSAALAALLPDLHAPRFPALVRLDPTGATVLYADSSATADDARPLPIDVAALTAPQ